MLFDLEAGIRGKGALKKINDGIYPRYSQVMHSFSHGSFDICGWSTRLWKFHIRAEKQPELEQDARDAFTRLENGETEELKLWQWFRDESLKEFTEVYDMLDIQFDSYAGESFYSDKMARFLKELEEKNIMTESEGAKVVDLEEEGMGTALITKSDGSTLYTTRDIAAAV